VLKARTEASSSAGHRIRISFYADLEFLRRFGIPSGVSAYGSTEAGGLTHCWRWAATDIAPPSLTEGVSHFGGAGRPDIESRIADDGEILVRELEPGAMFSGYLRRGVLDRATDSEGWFHTGDLGRYDGDGRLVFIERRSESIRVRGEFIPIEYVETQFRDVTGVSDVALWKESRASGDDVPMLYVVGDIDITRISDVASRLPRFMRPASVVRIEALPRDEAAGKVRRRLLATAERLDTWDLADRPPSG
jgi:acyl-CoA synthetase (AMP-forming)/AMP-acid ligase II